MKKTLSLLCALVLAGCGGSDVAGPPPPTLPSPAPVANFAGTYSGTYTVTSCGHTGDFAVGEFCDQLGVGSVLPMTLTLTQNGSAVTGTLVQGLAPTKVTGTVSGSGHLTLDGSGSAGGFTLLIVGWDTSLSGGVMTGSWNTQWTYPGLFAGYAQVVNTISPLARTAAVAEVPLVAQSLRPGDLQGALRAVQGR
jgi:hypothetical protein